MNSDFCLPGPPLPPHPPSRRSGYRSSRHLRPPSPPVYLPHATRSSPPLVLPYMGPCLFHVFFPPHRFYPTRRHVLESAFLFVLAVTPLCDPLPPAISCFVLCLFFVKRHPPPPCHVPRNLSLSRNPGQPLPKKRTRRNCHPAWTCRLLPL